MWKKALILLLALLTFSACQSEAPAGSVQIANPFTTCHSLAEAEEVTGFSLSLPEELAACEGNRYRAANSESLTLLEVICTVGEDEVRIRKGISDSDISVVYTEYDVSAEYCGQELSFTLEGDGEKDYLAKWSLGDYCYSITSEQGMEPAILQEWVYSTK